MSHDCFELPERAYCEVGKHASIVPELFTIVGGEEDLACCTDCGATPTDCLVCGETFRRRELNSEEICAGCVAGEERAVACG